MQKETAVRKVLCADFVPKAYVAHQKHGFAVYIRKRYAFFLCKGMRFRYGKIQIFGTAFFADIFFVGNFFFGGGDTAILTERFSRSDFNSALFSSFVVRAVPGYQRSIIGGKNDSGAGAHEAIVMLCSLR